MNTRVIAFLAAALFGASAIPARAQLNLPWEKDKGKTNAGPTPGTPEKAADLEDGEGPASTPVMAAYRFYLDLIAREPAGRVMAGTPRVSATEIGLTVKRDGKVTRMVFVEKDNDGQKAVVVFGPEASEGVVFAAEKEGAGWTARLDESGSGLDMTEPPVETMGTEPPPAAGLTWSDLSQRRLTPADFAGMDLNTLRLLRNEVYARHGRSFRSEDLRRHFAAQPWYVPRVDEIADEQLPAIELANVHAIREAERQMGSHTNAVPEGGGAMSDLLTLPEARAFQALLQRKHGPKAQLKVVEEETPNAAQIGQYGFRFTGVRLGYEDPGLARFMPWERFAIREDTGALLHYDVVGDAYESLAAWRQRQR